jgi:hypothetical protein
VVLHATLLVVTHVDGRVALPLALFVAGLRVILALTVGLRDRVDLALGFVVAGLRDLRDLLGCDALGLSSADLEGEQLFRLMVLDSAPLVQSLTG